MNRIAFCAVATLAACVVPYKGPNYYGLAPDFADDLVRRVARLTPRDVLALARKELDPAHELLVVGGGRKPLSKAFTDAKLTPANLIDATD